MKKLILLAALCAGCNTDIHMTSSSSSSSSTGGPPVPEELGWLVVETTVDVNPPGVSTLGTVCRTFDNPFGQDVDIDEALVRTENIDRVELFIVDQKVGCVALTNPVLDVSQPAATSVHLDFDLLENEKLVMRLHLAQGDKLSAGVSLHGWSSP